ncbi:MAG TPA: FAD-dependent oxidoreductase, partial [Desulfobacteraceae bacterium]|nr:FAD-dependent oxidoreductase [Desulfobacteraceae bacterium]
IALFFMLDLDRFFSIAEIKSRLDIFKTFYQNHTIFTMGIYMGIYVTMAALSLPGAAIMTLCGGALFGLFTGTVLATLSSTTGATLAFLISRYLFKELVQQKFSSRLATINRGIEKEGAFYLFTLRLVPIFPFFLINLAMGVTRIKTAPFFLVSLVGMVPGAMVYVNAGTQLAELDSARGILSWDILLAFALLGIFPLIAKRITEHLRSRKIYSKFARPGQFDYNVVTIGGGSAGLVASYIAAAVKAKTALVEEHRMGGDCLNTGCVPSKAMIASARLAHQAKTAHRLGFKSVSVEFDFGKIMERVRATIQHIAPHDSRERYTALGVDCFDGRAKIISPFEVAVNDQVLTTRNIIVATGAKPMIPPLPGLETIDYLTSDTVWNLTALPRRLVVLGGGPIGCELAQAFSRLGSRVTLVQRGERIMKKEDPDAALLVHNGFEQEGITIFTGHSPEQIEVNDGEKQLICSHQGQRKAVPFDRLLIALGRTPNVDGFGLEELGVELTRGRAIETNGFLQTNFPNIFCSGDVHGRYQFTHTAAHESWHAAVNALFGWFKKFRVDYSTIPWATFTDPEVARVGLNETEAQEAGIAFETVKYHLDDLDRAIADARDRGFVKVLTVPGRDKILGVTIVGDHASEIIAEYILAMKHGLGLNKILGTIHIYPTMAEANKYAAGMWKKAHAPEKLLAWIKRYHAWMRR